METIVRALRQQHAELDVLLSGCAVADWNRPAPDCPGWTLGDVVLHLEQTDRLVMASAEERFAETAAELTGPADGAPADIDDFVERMVRHGRGLPPAELHQRWWAGAEAVAAMFAACDPRRPLTWAVTPLPARTLATTRLAETWLHTVDVAAALGVAPEPGGRLWHVARLAWRTIPYAFARAGLEPPAGPVAVRLTAPDGTAWDFEPDQPAATVVSGPARDFCLVAGRRLEAAKSALTADGPDAATVLTLLRTYA